MKGNPISSMRYRYQSYDKVTDEPYESEWAATKDEAIKFAKMDLIRGFEKFGQTEYVMKIFNEMNRKIEPIIITLDEALREQKILTK